MSPRTLVNPFAGALLVASLAAQNPAPVPAPAQAPEPAKISKQDLLEAVKEALPIDISGGIYLWHYQPFLSGAKPNSEIYYAYLNFDVDMPGDIDFHLQTMFRDSKLRQYFTSNVWIQEGYLDWKPLNKEYGHLKVGKVYSQFGRFWDGCFYGNVPYFDGLKLDPDLGLSYEHHVALSDHAKADLSVQYFTRDSGTNGSLQGRDTLSLPGARQRNIFTARFAPTFDLGGDTSLTVGTSGMVFEADQAPSANPILQDDTVSRWNVEAAVKMGKFEVFGDVTKQDGTHAPQYPTAGIAEDRITYVMSGISWDVCDWVKVGYNFSMGDYDRSDVREIMHMPRMQFQVTKAASIWLEYVKWDQEVSGPDTKLDDSLNLILYASF